jgi:hypothetical protein
VPRALSEGDRWLARFDADRRRMLRAPTLLTAGLLALVRRPRLARATLRMMNLQPRVMRRLLGIAAGYSPAPWRAPGSCSRTARARHRRRPGMRRWADHLSELGHVVTFDYPYMKARRKMPDRMPALIEAHRAALADVRAQAGEAPVFLAGKSMGSRVGCHLSLEERVAGSFCFGYPLVSGSSGACATRCWSPCARPSCSSRERTTPSVPSPSSRTCARG